MGWQAVEFDDAAKGRIKQAAAFEKRLRLESLLNLPSECGPFTLRQFTLRDSAELEYSENGLMVGNPTDEDFLLFLWQLKPANDKRKISKFIKYAHRNLTDEIKLEIMAYMTAQYNEFPSGGETVNEFDSSVPACTLLDICLSEYGWSIEYALDCPVLVIGQLFQRMLRRKDPKYTPRSGITQAAKAKEMNHG